MLDTDSGGWALATPLQRVSTLADANTDEHQGVGPILLHPNGHTLYVTNRAYEPGLLAPPDKIVNGAAENSIVVYAIDQETGLIELVQRVDSGGACPRTLSLDPTGSVLVVTNSETWSVRDADGVRTLAANLTVFAVRADGTLERGRSLTPAHAPGSDIVWADIVALPADSDTSAPEVTS